MTFLRKYTDKAVFSGPFFWLFTTRLILTVILTTIAGVAFAFNYIALGIFVELCAVVLVGTVVTKMHSAMGVAELSPKERHARNLMTIAEHTSNLGLVMDSRLRITWVNPAFTRVTGYTSEEAIGKTPDELLNRSDDGVRSRVVQASLNAQSKGKSIRIEILNRKKDGSIFWTDTDIQPTFDFRHQLSGFFEIGVDITEQKIMIQRLHEQAHELERLANVARFTSNGVVILNIENQVVWSNSAAPGVLGVAPGALLYFNLDDLQRNFHARHFESMQTAMLVHANGGTCSSRMEFELADDNAGRWLDAEWQPLFSQPTDSASVFEGWMLIVSDITTRKNSVDALRVNEVRLRAIYDVLPVGLTIADNNGIIIDCNKKSEELLDIRREDYLHRRIDDAPSWFFTDESGATLEAEQLPSSIALRRGIRIENQIIHLVTPKSDRWLSVSAIPIEDENCGVAVAYVDISQQQCQYEAVSAARAQAERASQGKSDFLANMSHEIRTPMNAIAGLLSLMHDTELSKKQRDYLEKTNMAAKSLLGLLSDVLDLSKVESGKIVLDPQPLIMSTFWSDLSSLLQGNVDREDVELIFNIARNIPTTLILDTMRFQQILINLLSNALTFTQNGWVELRATWSNNRLYISVMDTGIGISDENKAHLFDGFLQADVAMTRRFGGTGLGLAITQRLVHLMGSELTVHSVPEKGSTFSFSIECPVENDVLHKPDLSSCLVVSSYDLSRNALISLAEHFHTQVDTDVSFYDALHRLQGIGAPIYNTLYLDIHPESFNAWHLVQALDQDLLLESTTIVFFIHPHEQNHHFHHVLDHTKRARLVQPRPATFDSLHNALWEEKISSHDGSAPSNKPLHGLHILVVEDNPINQQVAQELLEKKGALVTLANHGQHAVDVLSDVSTNWPDLVLMDIRMPIMDGYAATIAIRALPGGNALPIVSMTTSNVISGNEITGTSFDGHLCKPFDAGELVEILLQLTRLKMT